ncbi:MAG: helix-turn-helix domain-containing protein [Desulfovibrio sp.]
MNKGHIRYIRPPQLEGLEIQEVVNSNHSFPNHTHSIHSVGFMAAGGCYCRQPGHGSSFIRKGEIALFNPGFVHSGVIDNPDTRITYRVFSFENELIKKLSQELAQKDTLPEFTDVVIQDKLASSTLTNLCKAVAAPDNEGESRLALDTALSSAIAALVTRHSAFHSKVPQTKEPVAVERTKEYLHANMSDKVTLEKLSEVAGLSRYHLLRVFKQQVGLSPHNYHLQLRIEQSKRLLRQGTSYAQVAAESGFTDQSHFSNTFRKYTGATPGQYAQV